METAAWHNKTFYSFILKVEYVEFLLKAIFKKKLYIHSAFWGVQNESVPSPQTFFLA